VKSYTSASGSVDVARRCGPDILDGKPVGAWDRLQYALGNLLVYGPLRNVLGMSRIRVAYTAGAAIGPDLFRFYRSIGINLKQLYGSTETSVFVCIQPNDKVKPDTVGPAVPGVELKFTRERAQAWLRLHGYEPTTLHLSAFKRLGARITSANVAFDDHPDEKRFSDRIETVTVDSVFRWLERDGLGGTVQVIR